MKVYITKIKRMGKTKFISITKDICKSENLIEKGLVKVSIQNTEEDISEYYCVACQHLFYINDNDDLFCPACENENIIKQEEVINED